MNATFEDVKDGNVLWYVTVYNIQGLKRAYLERMEIVGSTYKTGIGSTFCKCKKDNSKYVSEFSLLDANIIPNSYNEHMTFTTEAEAYSYMGSILGRGDAIQLVNARNENASLRRVLGLILDSTSPMVKINAIREARGLLGR